MKGNVKSRIYIYIYIDTREIKRRAKNSSGDDNARVILCRVCTARARARAQSLYIHSVYSLRSLPLRFSRSLTNAASAFIYVLRRNRGR